MPSMMNDYRWDLETLRKKTHLLLEDPNGQRYAAARINEALNDAQLDLVLDTHLILVTAYIQLLADDMIYDLKAEADRQSLRAFGLLRHLEYIQDEDYRTYPGGNPVLNTLGTKRLDLAGIRLMSTNPSGETLPTLSTIDLVAPGAISILPIPTSDGDSIPTSYDGNLKFIYVAMPTQMSSDSDFPDSLIPAIYHQGLPYGAAYRFMDEGGDEDVGLADYFEGEFQAWIRKANGEIYAGMTSYNDMRPA